MNLSEHFTLAEGVFSSTALRFGIDNTPNTVNTMRMQAAAKALEAVRELLGAPMHVDSWYRCEALNKAVGGSLTSAHMEGYAIDFICPAFGTPLEIVRAIVDSGIKFDQCIQEGRWVHISFDPRTRMRVLTAHFDASGKATYTQGA